VADKRRQYEDPANQAYAYYRDFDLALVRGLRSGTVHDELGRVAATVTRPGQAQHYAALSAGVTTLLRRAPVRRVLDAWPRGHRWHEAGLTLTVTPTVVVELAKGVREVWFLHHKEPPLTQGMAEAPLVVLQDVLRAADSPLVPRVVDVRRGVRFAPNRRRREADRRNYVRVEAETFLRYWTAAAPAA
jgi:hypothetical protein